MITVWEFRSVDGKQCVISIRPMEIDDYRYQHEFQLIIYRGDRSGYLGRIISGVDYAD